jgi:isoaspartyl peptidase/L-asparaginase-like protein (Ntn-hydrolase superfamily)
VQQHVRSEVQQQQQQGRQVDEDTHHTQTVGAVAIDSSGRLAAATSTGGRTCKVSTGRHSIAHRERTDSTVQGCTA